MKKDTQSPKAETIQLEDFVAESLSQIIKGVSSAQKSIKGSSALINPVGSFVFKDNRGKQLEFNFKPTPQVVEFDIAVTATSGDNAKGGIGVFIGSVGLGVQAESNMINSIVNRIKFSIPIYLPQELDENTQNVPKPPSQHPARNIPGL